MIVYVFDHRRVRYWVAMNGGRPVIGDKHRAAKFYGTVTQQAVRQVSALFREPGYLVGAMNERTRFCRKAVTG